MYTGDEKKIGQFEYTKHDLESFHWSKKTYKGPEEF